MILNKINVKTEYFEGLSTLEYQSLVLLYPALISPLAQSLFLMFIHMGQTGIQFTYEDLAALLNVDVFQVESARIELEQFDLTDTYEYQGRHILQLTAPLKPRDLINHLLYGRLLAGKLPASLLHQITLEYAVTQQQSPEGKNISMPFDKDLLAQFSNDNEAIYQQVRKQEGTSGFNLSLLLDQLTDTQFPMHQRTQANLNLIETYAQRYQLTILELKRLIARSVDDQRQFNQTTFRNLMEQQLVVVSDAIDNPYELASEQFLQTKQPNLPLNEADLNLIGLLRKKYQFEDDLINVLFDYVLDQSKGQLSKRYIEKIASSWVRGKVKTSSEALQYLRQLQETKPAGKSPQKVIKDVGYQKDVPTRQTMDEIKAALKEFYPDDENL